MPPVRPLITGAALLAVAAAAVAADARFRQPYRPRLEQVEFPLPSGHEGLAGLRIGFVTDTHIGPFIAPSDFRRSISIVRHSAPDIVLLGGDYISESPRYTEAAADVLGELSEIAPLGCYAVLGNHDISTDQTRISQALTSAGIRVLRNEAVCVATPGGQLWIAGIDETILGRADPAATFTGIPADAAVIALWHEPDDAAKAAAHGAFAQLSGHSHGGQVRLPGIGPLVLPPGGRKYPAGRYIVDGMHLYTSRGTGVYRPPVRLNCPPEVTIVTLATNAR